MQNTPNQDTPAPVELSNCEVEFIQERINYLKQMDQQIKSEIRGAITLIIKQRELTGSWQLSEDLKTMVFVSEQETPIA